MTLKSSPELVSCASLQLANVVRETAIHLSALGEFAKIGGRRGTAHERPLFSSAAKRTSFWQHDISFMGPLGARPFAASVRRCSEEMHSGVDA